MCSHTVVQMQWLPSHMDARNQRAARHLDETQSSSLMEASRQRALRRRWNEMAVRSTCKRQHYISNPNFEKRTALNQTIRATVRATARAAVGIVADGGGK